MKSRNDHLEITIYSKVLAAKYSQSEIVKRFNAFIKPAVEFQDANTKKFYPDTLRNNSPVYLS
jgi:hypothetical protein